MKRIQQDSHWKELLNIKMVVREILSVYVRQDVLEHFDLDRLEGYPTEHITHAGRLLQNDVIWTVPSIENPDVRLFMFIIFEQQSRVDQAMVLRISNYVNALWGELYRRREKGTKFIAPPVLPLVIYTGTDSWTAATTREEFMGRGKKAGISEQITSGSGYILLDIPHHEPAVGQGLFRQIHRLYRARTKTEMLQGANRLAKLLRQLQPELAQHIEMFVETIAALIERRTGIQIDPQTIRDKILNKDTEEDNMSLLFSEELVAAHEKELFENGRRKGEKNLQEAKQKLKVAKQEVKEAKQEVKEAKQEVKEAKQEVKEAKQEVKAAKQEAKAANKKAEIETTKLAEKLAALCNAVAKAGMNVVEIMNQAKDPKKRAILFTQYGIS